MIEASLQPLYPGAGKHRAVVGLYLDHKLRELAAAQTTPFVYSNFIVSLDGRIAVPSKADPARSIVPPSMGNERDWRLFQELAVQSDILIVSGSFISKYGAGLAEEMVQVEKPAFADLKQWRKQQGLQTLPDLAVMSRGLDFTIPAALIAGGRGVHIFTPVSARPEKIASLREQGAVLHLLSPELAAAAEMVRILGEVGYRLIFSPAGPNIFHQLLQAKLIQRLYLTHAQQLVGRHNALPLVDGPLLDPPPHLELRELYLDPGGDNGSSQLLATYELKYVSS